MLFSWLALRRAGESDGPRAGRHLGRRGPEALEKLGWSHSRTNARDGGARSHRFALNGAQGTGIQTGLCE